MTLKRVETRGGCLHRLVDEILESDKYNKVIKYLCYGIEICPTTGNEHLQGYITLYKGHECTILTINKYLSLCTPQNTSSARTPVRISVLTLWISEGLTQA